MSAASLTEDELLTRGPELIGRITLWAAHPCPCGYFGDMKCKCRCSPVQVQRYQQRISGPLLDRIDLPIEVPAVREILNEIATRIIQSSGGED